MTEDSKEFRRAVADPVRVCAWVFADSDDSDGVGPDVTDWFEQATDEQLENLALTGWGPSESQDILDYILERNPEVAQFVQRVSGRTTPSGQPVDPPTIELYAHDDSSAKWIWQNRPHLAQKLLEDNLISEEEYYSDD